MWALLFACNELSESTDQQVTDDEQTKIAKSQVVCSADSKISNR